MIFRNTDANGDWTFGSGKNNYATDSLAIAADIKTKILEWKNDCFFSLTSGIDWLVRLGYKNQKTLLDQDLQNIVISNPLVVQMTSFDSVLTDGKYTATIRYKDIYGISSEVLI